MFKIVPSPCSIYQLCAIRTTHQEVRWKEKTQGNQFSGEIRREKRREKRRMESRGRISLGNRRHGVRKQLDSHSLQVHTVDSTALCNGPKCNEKLTLTDSVPSVPSLTLFIGYYTDLGNRGSVLKLQCFLSMIRYGSSFRMEHQHPTILSAKWDGILKKRDSDTKPFPLVTAMYSS